MWQSPLAIIVHKMAHKPFYDNPLPGEQLTLMQHTASVGALEALIVSARLSQAALRLTKTRRLWPLSELFAGFQRGGDGAVVQVVELAADGDALGQ